MVKRFLLLNGLATIASVIHHAISWELIAMFWWADRYRPVTVPDLSQIWSPNYITLRVIDQFAFPAVIAFLIVSGYFVTVAGSGPQKTVKWALVLRRAKNLAIPYLIWSMVIIGFNLVQGNTYATGQLIRILLAGNASPPYYYVPLLIQLYLLAPLLVVLAKQKPRLLIAIVLLIQIPVTYSHYTGILKMDPAGLKSPLVILREWHLLGYLIWFVFGIMIGLHMEGFKKLINKIRLPLLIALILVFFASIAEWELIRRISGREWLASQVTIGGKLFALLLLTSFFAFDKLSYPFANAIGQIGTRSFGVYLIHVLVLEIIARGTYHVAPWLLAYQPFHMVLLTSAGVGVPLLMMAAVNRTQLLRRFYAYLFG